MRNSFGAALIQAAVALLAPSCMESNPQPSPQTDAKGGMEWAEVRGPGTDLVPSHDVKGTDFRGEMRSFVGSIAAYARAARPGFVVIPQNGLELLTASGEPDGDLAEDYVEAIDGCGQEDLNFGYPEAGDVTPPDMHDPLVAFLDRLEAAGRQALVIDYCTGEDQADASLDMASKHGFVAFPADSRDLDDVPAYPPEPFEENADSVSSLAQVRNFLYLINPGEFGSKEAFLSAVAKTDFDLIVVDAFFDSDALTSADVAALKQKANGGKRLVISYLSIGEAEDYRFYWDDSWKATPPSWLEAENPDWEGNYKVRYWDPAWQAIIFGAEEAYLDRILAAGFDGAYLDIIDAYWWFEEVVGQ
jgi:cysteinyl-tRNA synthetase